VVLPSFFPFPDFPVVLPLLLAVVEVLVLFFVLSPLIVFVSTFWFTVILPFTVSVTASLIFFFN